MLNCPQDGFNNHVLIYLNVFSILLILEWSITTLTDVGKNNLEFNRVLNRQEQMRKTGVKYLCRYSRQRLDPVLMWFKSAA